MVCVHALLAFFTFVKEWLLLRPWVTKAKLIQGEGLFGCWLALRAVVAACQCGRRRDWGASNWWQNTRLPYGSMLAAG
jgi:hypothetical protein